MKKGKQNLILIDIGSSTIKAYSLEKGSLKPILQRSIPFKNNFSPETGISTENKKELIELLKSLKNENPSSRFKTYATAIFRKMNKKAKTQLIDEIFQATGIYLNIISQDLENFYLEMALVGKANLRKNVLLINIGGGSTEIVVVYGKEAIERKNIDLGVGTIIEQFPSINNPFSGIPLDKVVEKVKEKLPSLSNTTEIAFYTGGELTYMQLTNYPLETNRFFSDPDHPLCIKFKNFARKNEIIFNKISIKKLEALMPENPGWMHGARACSAIAQAICEKYKIKYIIPSNSNIINGIIRQEFKYVTISGSFRKHLSYIIKVKEELEKKGTTILSPRFITPKNPDSEFVIFDGEEGLTPLQLERYHLNSITKSDALIVCNPQGYVGASSLIEIGYAQALAKRIIFTEKPEEFMLNTLPAEIGL